MNGYINTILIAFVIFFAVLLGGNLFSSSSEVPPSGGATPAPVANNQCCDLGNGEDCKVQKGAGKQFTFEPNGQEYGLLKSNAKLSEAAAHLQDSGLKAYDQFPIIMNTSDGYSNHTCSLGQDLIWGPLQPGSDACHPIPNDQLLYVCKENCRPFDFSKPTLYAGKDLRAFCGKNGLTCYGDTDTIYDIYFRIADEENIPDVIKNCHQNGVAGETPVSRQEVIVPSLSPQKNLQLGNLKIITVTPDVGTNSWISPWCKPAIYLYPEKTTEVNVKVKALGGLTVTLPKYPSSGWDVTAYPDGTLNYQGTNMSYLYYESRIRNSWLEEPKEGYVVEYAELFGFLDELLPKLGLNQKESTDFIKYWESVLPESNYYFVGLVPQQSLEKIADLEVMPKPESQIRVTLLFRAFEEPISVSPPTLETVNRNGFTLVEWGGIYKVRDGEEFSCLM